MSRDLDLIWLGDKLPVKLPTRKADILVQSLEKVPKFVTLLTLPYVSEVSAKGCEVLTCNRDNPNRDIDYTDLSLCGKTEMWSLSSQI